VYLLIVIGFSNQVLEAASVQTSPGLHISMIIVYLAAPIGGTLILLEAVITLFRRLRGLPPFEHVVGGEA
jgi:TRAP-type C4-dicarboxylate transport system permease small subunit